MKASDYIVEKMLEVGTDKVFGYIGGMITHLADSIFQNKNIEMINAIHEQGAGFMAEGYARNTDKIGIAIATSGPGATNLLTPITSCYFDSTPALFITGQVNTHEYKKFPNIRQCGFQETNIVDMAKPVTKYAVMVQSVEDLRYELEKCLYLAQNGRKGPVLLDIPMNIQRAEVDFSKMKSFFEEIENCSCQTNLDELKEILNSAKRPVILVGGGVRLANSTNELKDFLAKTNMPVVQSLMGLDTVSSDYKYNLGLIGAYANRYGNFTLANSDLILVLGSRLDLRQIGAKAETFARSAKIIQVDIDEHELDCDNLDKITIKSDIKTFLNELNKEKFNIEISDWQKKVLEWKNEYPSTKSIDGSTLMPNLVISKIFENLKNTDTVSVDVGQNQMWVAQSASIKEGQRIFFSGGLGSMGFALPCAIGAGIEGQRAVVISGDGGFQMNIQELEVIKRRNLPVKMIVLNNQSLGMVRQFQEIYFEGRLQSTVEDYSAPDFAKVANSYGIKAQNLNADEITDKILKDFFSNNEPELLNIYLEQNTDLQPKLIFGQPIENMHPFLDKAEFSKTMLIEPLKESLDD